MTDQTPEPGEQFISAMGQFSTAVQRAQALELERGAEALTALARAINEAVDAAQQHRSADGPSLSVLTLGTVEASDPHGSSYHGRAVWIPETGGALAYVIGNDGSRWPLWCVHSFQPDDVEAARALWNAAQTIKATGGAVEIAGVRIEPCDEYGATDTTRVVDRLAKITREQIADAIHDDLLPDGLPRLGKRDRLVIADAVLTLLNGGVAGA